MIRMQFSIVVLLLGLSFDISGQDKYIWVFLNTNPEREELPIEEVEEYQRKHIENIGKLARENKLLVAGPFNNGGGILIMNTDDINMAREWILTDPAIRANRFHVEMFQWTPRTGDACLVDENAPMEEHDFVRFVPHITKFNVQQAPELFLEHDRYIEQSFDPAKVLAEGIFDNNDGGIMIFRGDMDKAKIMADPTVVEGLFIPEFKTIWVAKGSFCR